MVEHHQNFNTPQKKEEEETKNQTKKHYDYLHELPQWPFYRGELPLIPVKTLLGEEIPPVLKTFTLLNLLI